jgi:hypothetical protein
MPEIYFSIPEAGLSGQRAIKRAQNFVVFGALGAFPLNFKIPVRQKISLS